MCRSIITQKEVSIRIYVCMCTKIVIHMNLSIGIRRSISMHVSISITMSNFACLLGWS